MPYLTGREFLHLIADIRQPKNNGRDIGNLLSELGLQEMADEIIKKYSHGMRQKISLAAAIICKPKYMIFDEALNGFDPEALFNAKNIFNNLSQSGHTIILSSHVIELIKDWCNHIIIMHEGKLLADYTSEKIKAIEIEKSFQEYFIELIHQNVTN